MKGRFKNSLPRRTQMRNATARWWSKWVASTKAAGLTTRGTPRKYAVYNIHKRIHGKRRRNKRLQILRDRLAANGFSIRGRSKWTPIERAWKETRATISVPSNDWERVLTPLERGEQ